MKKILTHAGTFHADEISAVALLLSVYPGAQVTRTYDAETVKAAQADQNTFVVDIGRQYQPGMLNFDHHQDANLPASNTLVLDHLVKNQIIQERQAELLEKYFFYYISQVDCGQVVEKAGATPTISGIIRACNNLPEDTAFDAALGIMRSALDAQLATIDRRIESEPIWHGLEISGKHGAFYVIHDNAKHIVGWHELAEESNVQYLVTPNARGGYQITSRDSELWPIPPHPSQTFRHNSGFLAAYPTIQDCVNHLSAIAGQ